MRQKQSLALSMVLMQGATILMEPIGEVYAEKERGYIPPLECHLSN